MASPRLVIFDWDGTLMDSERQIVHCMQMATHELGLVVPTYESVRSIIGLGLPEALARVFPHYELPVREAIRQAYARHFVAGSAGNSDLFPGALSLLEELRERGHLLAVATGKSRLGLNRVFLQTGMTHYFNASRCADETASKPDPLMLLQILDELKVLPEDALMIGDTTFDLEMAERAAVPRIGVAHGVHDTRLLRRYKPLAIVNDLPDLAACLRSL